MTGERSGVWSVFTGVGTATTWNFALRKSLSSEVNSTVVLEMTSSPTSSVGSTPDLYTLIFSAFKSKPITRSPFFAKATAIGIPT